MLRLPPLQSLPLPPLTTIRKEKTAFYRCHTFLMLSLLLQNIVSSTFYRIFPNTISSSLCVGCVHDISIQQRHYYSSMTEQWRWKSNKSFAFTCQRQRPARYSMFVVVLLLIWCTVREIFYYYHGKVCSLLWIELSPSVYDGRGYAISILGRYVFPGLSPPSPNRVRISIRSRTCDCYGRQHKKSELFCTPKSV